MSAKGSVRSMTLRSKQEVFNQRNIFLTAIKDVTDRLVSMLLGEENYTPEDVKRLNDEIETLRTRVRVLEWVLGLE